MKIREDAAEAEQRRVVSGVQESKKTISVYIHLSARQTILCELVRIKVLSSYRCRILLQVFRIQDEQRFVEDGFHFLLDAFRDEGEGEKGSLIVGAGDKTSVRQQDIQRKLGGTLR